MRKLTLAEIEAVQHLGTTAEDWSKILVTEDFSPEQLIGSENYMEGTHEHI